MKLSRRTNTIILWTISLGLLVSMVIAFTPSLGTLFGGGNQQQGQTALEVNGVKVSELELARIQQNPPFNLTLEGEAGDDLDTLLVDSLANNTLIQQAAADVRVSNREVNEAVNEFRESQGVAGSRNDRSYLSLIQRFGYTDATFRDYYRDQLKVEKYQESITDGIEVSDEEVQAYYELNEQNYQSEERILARAIVLEDAEAADAALERVQADEDFATLAEELSTDRADRGGALGAGEGSSDPQPVGRAALPTEVANAAFGLLGAGTTEVISAGSEYYIVDVEEYIPAGTEPFEEVADEVREDALEAKRAGELERTLEELRASAQLTLPENSTLSLEDPAVATVGDEEIKRSDLARSVYLNPQIQQSLSGDNASLITGLFKPSILEQLISQKLAYRGAQDLDATFIGPEAQVAQNALNYVSRDATAAEEDLTEYYEANQASFTVPAQSVVTRANFASENDASGFRAALLDGEDLQTSAERVNGEIVDLGTVRPGTLQPEIDTALFGTEAFSALPESEEEISDILVLSEPVAEDPEEVSDEAVEGEDGESEDGESTEEADDESLDESGDESAETTEAEDATDIEEATEDIAEEVSEEAAEDASTDETADAEEDTEEPEEVVTENVYVVLVAERTPERVRSFEEVRAQVEDTVLQTKRSELQTAWLDGLREDIPVENLLEAAAEDSDFETTPLEDGEGDSGEGDSGEGDTDATDESAEASGDSTDGTDEVNDEAVEEVAEEAVDESAVEEAVEEVTEETAEETATEVEDAAEDETVNADEASEDNSEETVDEAATDDATGEDASSATEEDASEEGAPLEDDSEEDTPADEESGTEGNSGLDALIAAATATVADSVNLEEAETRAAEFTEELRPLANRDDLSESQQDELATLTANLEKVQAEVVEFTGSEGTYTVQPGDTLSSIASDFYSDSSEWETILEANNYLIDDPDLIFPGFILLIPGDES